MTTSPLDRRLHRRQSAIEQRIVSARVRPGHSARVIDVSEGGALIETRRGLNPGTVVEVQFNTAQQMHTVRGRVLRCSVAELRPYLVCYRAAINFEYRVPTDEPIASFSGGVTPSRDTV